jgi:hypothetical protein
VPGDNAQMRRSACLLAFLLACGDANDPDTDAAPHDAAMSEDAAALSEDAAALTVDASDAAAPAPVAVRLPPANGGLDYQLGGSYPPPTGVTIVARDRTAMPAPGLYNICYVNGFQAQESEAERWLADHPDLILRDARGEPVIDRDWNEMLLDVGSEAKRAQLASVVGDWIVGCARAGFDAVEIDNLDSFTRSGDRLREDDAVAFLALLAARAHAAGLAIAQKNSSELAQRRREFGADFVVAEECSRYDECEVYLTAYGSHVLMVEYRRGEFDRGCAQHPDSSIVLRDLDLVTPQDSGYVFEGC